MSLDPRLACCPQPDPEPEPLLSPSSAQPSDVALAPGRDSAQASDPALAPDSVFTPHSDSNSRAPAPRSNAPILSDPSADDPSADDPSPDDPSLDDPSLDDIVAWLNRQVDTGLLSTYIEIGRYLARHCHRDSKDEHNGTETARVVRSQAPTLQEVYARCRADTVRPRIQLSVATLSRCVGLYNQEQELSAHRDSVASSSFQE